MATLEEIDRALAAAKEAANGYPAKHTEGKAFRRSEYNASKAVEALEEAKRIAYLKSLAEDTSVDEVFREAARKEYNAYATEAKKNPKKYSDEIDKQNKYLGEYLGTSVKLESLLPELPEAPKAKGESGATPEVKPETAPSTSPTAPAKPAPEAPTPKAVKELDKGIEAIKAERLKQEQLKTKQMEREGEEADKAADQREYNALTPAQKLERSVRAREQGQAERARGAVEARREQLAADEEYKGMQIASSGSFKDGDVTQYVDPKERAAAQSYFTKRAADLRSGTNTAGARPVFSEDRSLTVVDIHPDHGGGKGTGASPRFASGDKFGPDPNSMAYEMIGGKPVPIMTVGQAFATQSRGPGINVYEKTGTIPQQLDALSARNIRRAAGKQAVDEQIEFALTGKRSPRAEEDKKKREAAAAAAEAATKMTPSDPSQPYS